MVRIVVTFGLLVGLAARSEAQSNPPVAAKRGDLSGGRVSLTKALEAVEKWSGIPVDTAGADGARVIEYPPQRDVPFWTALDTLAEKSGHRITLAGRGQKIAFVRRTGPPSVSSVDGPFRTVVREVVARRDAATGAVNYEIQLDLHWEPRFPVFRVGSQIVSAATDDRGSKLTAGSGSGKVPTVGYLYQTTVRLTGVPRSATKIARLEGTFTVTAADKMLRFAFDDPFKTPANKTDSGVSASLTRFAKDDGLWEARVELTYPAGQPVFESFESWLTENRCRLVALGTGKTFEPTDYELPAGGAKPVAVYRFKEDAAKGLVPGKGWTLEYETPTPLVEYTVKFTLKDIDLP